VIAEDCIKLWYHRPESTVSHYKCLFFWNSNKSPTRYNNFPIYFPDVYLQLNMFRAFSRPSSGTQWLQWQPLVLPSYRGDSRAPRTQHDCHHNTKVKPEPTTAIIGLLTMGEKTPETCWAVNKREDNKLENCCIRLVIYLNCTVMMHGLTNRKFIFMVVKRHFLPDRTNCTSVRGVYCQRGVCEYTTC